MQKFYKNIIEKLKNPIGKILNKTLIPLIKYSYGNTKVSTTRLATEQTALYICEKMPFTQSCDSWKDVHKLAIKKIKFDGLILEFGVSGGRSLKYLSKILKDKKIYGFDSFKGLPEDWKDGFKKGIFARNGKIPTFNSNVKLRQGWYSESIPIFIKEIIKNKEECISYLHIDCDLYSSTKTIFDLLGNRIKSGTVIVIDEYFNYAGWKLGEYKAFQEFIKQSKLNYEYLTYCNCECQVAVRII